MVDIQTPRYQTRLIPAYYDSTGGGWFIFTTDKRFIPVSIVTFNKTTFNIAFTGFTDVRTPNLFYQKDKATLFNFDLFIQSNINQIDYNRCIDNIEVDWSRCNFVDTMYMYKTAYDTNIETIDMSMTSVYLKVIVDNTQQND